MSASMRNAIQRNPHRERAQPLERRRLGLLEKHKDYSLRAKDYNKKTKQIKNLRAKASERNEDEFYYGMLSRKGPGSKIMDGRSWKGTVQGDRGNKSLSVDAVRLLKTQDIAYVRTMKQVAQKEVARLEEQLVLTKGLNNLDEDDEDEDEDDEDDDDFDLPPKSMRPKPTRKIVFLDTEEEREEVIDEQQDDEEEEFNGLDDDDDDKKSEEQEQREKSVRRLRKQLENSKTKLQVLKETEAELEVQQAKMAKTATSGGETRRGKKLKYRTRKR